MDAFWQWVANMLPRNLVYWSAIRLIAHATMGRWPDEQVTEVTAVATLRRWDEEGRTAQTTRIWQFGAFSVGCYSLEHGATCRRLHVLEAITCQDAGWRSGRCWRPSER